MSVLFFVSRALYLSPLCMLMEQLPLTFLVLIVAYLLSGLGSQLCEYILYFMTFAGINMSVAMHRQAQKPTDLSIIVYTVDPFDPSY